jgi:ubiquinone/menaquinone biosynthesis C-methylase UbiE
MRDTKAGARRWFDRRAASYDTGFTSRWRDPLQRESLAALELTAGDRLLDLGCGTGTASRAAAGDAAFVTGVDLSAEMIGQAFALASGIPNSRFAVADAEHLPFGDAAFTAVLCTNSFHHYPDPARAVREMARVLAPGGRLVLGDACSDLATARLADRILRVVEPGHVRLYRSDALAGFLHHAGFTEVARKRMQGGGFAIVRGRVRADVAVA